MADRVDKATRSRIMSSIKGKGTKMELAVRPVLDALGFDYQPRIKGHPDFAHHLDRVAIFLDGCFWHGCPEHFVCPESNRPFWSIKIGRNKARDVRTTEAMEAEGWTVIRIWEHEFKAKK